MPLDLDQAAAIIAGTIGFYIVSGTWYRGLHLHVGGLEGVYSERRWRVGHEGRGARTELARLRDRMHHRTTGP